MRERVPWERLTADEAPGDFLHYQASEHVGVGLQIDEQGDFRIVFAMGIVGSRRSLPEVEDFIQRCAAFLEAEPVVPSE